MSITCEKQSITCGLMKLVEPKSSRSIDRFIWPKNILLALRSLRSAEVNAKKFKLVVLQYNSLYKRNPQSEQSGRDGKNEIKLVIGKPVLTRRAKIIPGILWVLNSFR